MCFDDFITPMDFDDAKKRAKSQGPFEIVKEIKWNGSKIKVRVDGRKIGKDLAESVWHGKDYLVVFSCDYHGKMGIGGWGGATEKLSIFDSLESFKEWFDRWMRKCDGYEVEQFGQMALF